MWRISIIAIIIWALSFPAKADVCFPSFERDTSNAEIIFVGKVLKIEDGAYWTRTNRSVKLTTFQVIESFKGLNQPMKIQTILGTLQGCCSINFITDSTYLVFGYEIGSDVFWTNDCTASGLLTKTQQYYSQLGQPLVHDNIDRWPIFGAQYESEKDSLRKVILNIQPQLQERTRERRLYLYSSIFLLILVIVLIFKRFI